MKVLIAASESVPFIKTGGLGDVIGSLSVALNKSTNIDVRVILPKYEDISEEYKKEMNHVTHFNVYVGWRNQYCGIEKLEYNGVKFYFVDNEYYFKRSGLYGYFDDGERFTFFSRSILEGLSHIDFIPDIIHCNDWHTALIPLLLKEQYNSYDIKTLFSIHNLKYQGNFEKGIISDVVGLHSDYQYNDTLEFYGNVNFMKAAIYYSDFVTTVSPTYAEEIKHPFYGENLDGILKDNEYKLKGILNGIDNDIYNPQTDKYISVNYTRSIKKKHMNKTVLQEESGLPVNEKIPVISMVSRLVEQKGLDLLAQIVYDMLNMDIQFIVLGTGEEKYENMLKNLEQELPKKVKAYIKFDIGLAQKIYAGSDIILIPSLFEPCGITQMIAFRYGTIPIVRETGGLKDTVNPYNKYTGEGNGFSFANYNAHELLDAVKRALELYKYTEDWNKLIKSAFKSNYTIDKSAKEYFKVYEKLCS